MALDRPPIAAEIRATLAVAAPLAAANLAQMAMQVTNAVMVGHLGTVPLAAAGLGNALNAAWNLPPSANLRALIYHVRIWGCSRNASKSDSFLNHFGVEEVGVFGATFSRLCTAPLLTHELRLPWFIGP
jgi:hypothetical protein